MTNTHARLESNFGLWKKALLTTLFFLLTPITIGASIFSYTLLKDSPQLASQQINIPNIINNPQSGVQVYASLPDETNKIEVNIESDDARPEIIRQYLSYHNSPLEPYANFIISTADKYAIDYRLITAIAQQESNLCKKIPEDTHNCWGWGIHSKGTLSFKSFQEGIDIVSKGLKFNYINKGYVTPEEIMSKYTPLSNGSWAFGVDLFMNQMQ